MLTKHDQLYDKIIERLNRDNFESNSEFVSMSDVIGIINQSITLYRILLVDRKKKVIDKLNKSIDYSKFTPRFVSKSLPRVVNIINSVSKNGDVSITVLFENYKSIILTGNSENIIIKSSSFISDETIRFVNENSEIFKINLGTMLEFAENYPHIEMNFDKEYEQNISDGFISCNIKLFDCGNSNAYLSNLDDIAISLTYSEKYGKLNDYIVFYNVELLNKSFVNVNELNPFIKACVLKNLSLGKDEDFTLSL